MAEVLGATAAGLQIAGLFGQAGVRGYKLFKQLQDAPDEIRRKSQCLDDFRNLCSSCQDTLSIHSATISATVRSEDVARIQDLIKRAEQSLGSLEKILSKLQVSSSDTRVETWVKATKAVVKNGNISAHLGELNRITGHIRALFEQQTWMISMEHSSMTVNTLSDLQTSAHQIQADLLLLKQEQARNATDQNSAVAGLTSSIGLSNRGHDGMSKILETGFASSKSSMQIMEKLMRSHHTELVQLINSRTAPDGLHTTDASSPSGAVISQTSQRTAHVSEDTLQATVVRIPFRPRNSGVCPCQRVPFSQIYFVLGPVVIIKRTMGAHRPGCRHYNGITQTRTKEWFGMALTSQYGRTWAASLTRTIVTRASSFLRWMTYTRVFDDDQKDIPGFRRISQAQTAIRKIRQGSTKSFWEVGEFSVLPCKPTIVEVRKCREVLLKLRDDLEEDFSVSRDWEGVQTAQGKTLLFALAHLMGSLWNAQEEVVDLLDSIMELLIAGGTPTDAMILCSTEQNYNIYGAWDRRREIYHTALSYIILGEGIYQPDDNTPFLQLFAKWNVPSLPIAETPMDFNLARHLFNAVPEFAIEHGCSRICMAVISRDTYQLERLIQSGVKIDCPNDIVSPLALAIARWKLMETAKNHFSKSQLMEFGWNFNHFKGHLIDSVALRTYSELRARGVALEMKLWPGTTGTIYENKYMTTEVAEMLWAYGFRQIDAVDDLGRTLLSRHTARYSRQYRREAFDLLLWFISHGAETMVFSRMNNATLEGIMSIYEELTATYFDNFEELWETWWMVVETYIPQSLSEREKPTKSVDFLVAPILTDNLEDVLRDIRRHVVRTMEIAIAEKEQALEWLLERSELGVEV
ncbi:hypothetical protein PG991_001722 [Apiospora marii]|uniref:Fungal N-terminal domain-containing protein n=1 Tax=Apiospora marii TaxID=335849 RepID=A0ABR1SQI0_9PEZI